MTTLITYLPEAWSWELKKTMIKKKIPEDDYVHST